jgi:hypothetical protein
MTKFPKILALVGSADLQWGLSSFVRFGYRPLAAGIVGVATQTVECCAERVNRLYEEGADTIRSGGRIDVQVVIGAPPASASTRMFVSLPAFTWPFVLAPVVPPLDSAKRATSGYFHGWQRFWWPACIS